MMCWPAAAAAVLVFAMGVEVAYDLRRGTMRALAQIPCWPAAARYEEGSMAVGGGERLRRC